MKLLLIITLFYSFLFAAVDINNASIEELATLKDIGKKKAKRIIKYRKKHCFTRIEELLKIKCICKKTLKKNKGNITVGKCNNEEDDE